jgi:hypothetical protein
LGLAIVAVWIIFAASVAFAAPSERPLYTIASAVVPPQIDGRIGDPCWQAATCIAPFVLTDTADAPTQPTRAWMTYDDRALYIAFECREDRMVDLRVAHSTPDSGVWEDDSVEVFLDTARDREHYFHFVVNANGTQMDERAPRDPRGWDAQWQAAAARQPDHWTVEMAIPFSALGVRPPGLLDAWGFNLAREEQPHRELSEIALTRGNFHDVGRFPDLVFGGAQAVTAGMIADGDPFLGRRQAQARLCNFGSAPARVTLWVETPGTRQPRVSVEIPAQGSVSASVPYEVYAEGDLSMALNAADASGCSLLRSTPIAFHVAANQAKLAEVARGLDTLRDPARKRGLGLELDKIRAETDRALAAARDRKRWAAGNPADWERLASIADRLEVRANRLRLRALTADPRAGYAIGVESPLRKLRPDVPYRGAVGSPAQVWLARNEYEPAQVVVLALDKPLLRVRARATDLVATGPQGHPARIRADHVALNLVGFVQTRKPVYACDYVGPHPDPLLDLEPFGVPADGLQPIWVTVYCPPTAPAGDYAGEIIVKPDNAGETRVPLIAHVWDFTLPKETHLQTAFALSEGEIAAWYGYDRVPDDVRLRYYDFLLRRRINPTNIYSPTPTPAAADMAFCLSRGLNAFNLHYVGFPDTPQQRRAEVAQVRSYAQLLKNRGWLQAAYIYGFDEIRPEDYPKLREMYGAMREAVPGLPRACTVAPNDALKGYVDIWVPLTAAYDHLEALRCRAAGDQVWWYICCAPHHPYANWFIDYPATEPRLLFWMNWKYGVNGFLYYALNMWQSNRMADGLPGYLVPHGDAAARAAIAAGKRWPEVPWNTFTYDRYNGDGHLMYPGPNGKPISSLRLECIRDGIEDYEYFHLLAELTAAVAPPAWSTPPGRGGGSAGGAPPDRYFVMIRRARQLLGVDASVVNSLTEYTDDPEAIQRARRALGEQIQEMSRVAER